MVLQMARPWKHPDSGIYYVRRLIDSRVWGECCEPIHREPPAQLEQRMEASSFLAQSTARA
jgi:hypothetical protein